MPTGSINTNINIGSLIFAGNTQRSGETETTSTLALAAGNSGTLSTRTSDTAGTATLAADHTINTGDEVDIHWSGGYAYGATVGTVAGTSAPFTGAAGDVMPTQDAVIIVSLRTAANIDFDGDDMTMIAMQSDQRTSVVFEDVGDAVLLAQELPTANEPYSWADSQGVTRPITGNPVDEVQASSGATTAATLKLGVILDTV